MSPPPGVAGAGWTAGGCLHHEATKGHEEEESLPDRPKIVSLSSGRTSCSPFMVWGNHDNFHEGEHRVRPCREMDAGAATAWPERFNPDEISAIQHAMNLRLRDEAAFLAEYQNEPLVPDEETGLLTAAEIAAKTNGRTRGHQVGLHWIVPARTGRVVRRILIDTNYWKSFVYARLAVAMGHPVCLSLFGRDTANVVAKPAVMAIMRPKWLQNPGCSEVKCRVRFSLNAM